MVLLLPLSGLYCDINVVGWISCKRNVFNNDLRMNGFITWCIEMLMNIGPCHPSTHGVLRCIALMNAEVIEYCYTEIGLLHRGSEKLIESLQSFTTIMPYFNRLDYVSVVSQELLMVQACEKYINVWVYLYESFVRVMISELFRILNHSLAITTHAIDIGLFTSMLWYFEEREKIYSLFELLIGSRYHLAFLWIGKNRFDISLVFIELLLNWLINFIRKIIELYNVLSINSIWIKRLYEVGIIDRQLILHNGLSGIIIRAAGIMLDYRLSGYESYSLLNFNSYISFISDCLDRYLLRFNEFISSSSLIYSCIFNVVSINHSVYQSFSSNYMESIINDFLFNSSSNLNSFSFISVTIPVIPLTIILMLNCWQFFLLVYKCSLILSFNFCFISFIKAFHIISIHYLFNSSSLIYSCIFNIVSVNHPTHQSFSYSYMESTILDFLFIPSSNLNSFSFISLYHIPFTTTLCHFIVSHINFISSTISLLISIHYLFNSWFHAVLFYYLLVEFPLILLQSSVCSSYHFNSYHIIMLHVISINRSTIQSSYHFNFFLYCLAFLYCNHDFLSNILSLFYYIYMPFILFIQLYILYFCYSFLLYSLL
jgi:NADH:ubiquinone oxidoreductase subunit D